MDGMESPTKGKLAFLIEILCSIHSQFTSAIERFSADRVSLEAQAESISSQLAQAVAAKRAAQDQLNRHDTMDLDRIHWEDKNHTCRPYSLTPTFEFDIPTRFPIRDWTLLVPPTSSWTRLPNKSRLLRHHEPVYRFEAKLRNKRTASAYATVELRSWRRDIHAERIRTWREDLAHQTAIEGFTAAELSKLRSRISELRGCTAKLKVSRRLIAEDLVQLEGNPIVPKGTSSLPLSEENMYCFVKVLNLRTSYQSELHPLKRFTRNSTTHARRSCLLPVGE
jgi:hypothetical protein